ncbi:helix-turn-helix domain-containing protein [Bradyrhizobium sp. 2TAF24]|uniref:helix-turn-helix domain-containing protein n=1 Tax=Bradyrhizobium sp. 2TAF24 TaxID=3233011 RepID=UPI003F92ED71
MSFIDVSLRGGGIAVLLVLAVTAWRDGRQVPAVRDNALLDLCVIAYLIETMPWVAAIRPWWIVPIRALGMATPAVFQLWAAANFDDGFTPRWWRWLPVAGMLVLALGALISDWPPAWRVTQAAALLLTALGMWQTLAGRGGDLIERRRQLRVVLAVVAGLAILGLTVLGTATTQATRATGSVICAGCVLALVLAAALLRLRAPVPAPPSDAAAKARPFQPAREPPVTLPDQDRALLERLRRVMESERAYREARLGIAALAARLAIPQYRLRRLINEHLGHRNFTSFVNSYRLADTMWALADPTQEQVPVLTIALDAGFQSIGPFNRAFKAHTGLTPTEFRRDRLKLTLSRTPA